MSIHGLLTGFGRALGLLWARFKRTWCQASVRYLTHSEPVKQDYGRGGLLEGETPIAAAGRIRIVPSRMELLIFTLTRRICTGRILHLSRGHWCVWQGGAWIRHSFLYCLFRHFWILLRFRGWRRRFLL